jgi:hypothetical protein
LGAAGGAGESAGLGLPPMRRVIFGVGSVVVDIFSFNLGCAGSGTSFLACASCLWKKIWEERLVVVTEQILLKDEPQDL